MEEALDAAATRMRRRPGSRGFGHRPIAQAKARRGGRYQLRPADVRLGLVPPDPILEHDGFIMFDVTRGEQQRHRAFTQGILDHVQ